MKTKIYGNEVKLNADGKVLFRLDDGRMYPYEWDDKNRVWTNVYGYYTPRQIRYRIRKGRFIWK